METIRIVRFGITTKIISLFLTMLIIFSFVPIVLCEVVLVRNILTNSNEAGSFVAFLCLCFVLFAELILCYKILNRAFEKYFISSTGVQIKHLFKKQFAPWTAFRQVSIESISVIKLNEKETENKIICFVPKQPLGNSKRNRCLSAVCIKYDEGILSSLQSLCPFEISNHTDFTGDLIEQTELSDLSLYCTEEKCDTAIDFVGHVSVDCIRMFNKTIIKQNLIPLSAIFLSIILSSILFNWYILLFLIPFTLVGLSNLKVEQNELLPHRIRIDVESKKIIYNFQKMKRVHPFEEVKKVIDYGFCYHFVFKRSDPYFVCQKSLLTQGSLEEFEALFEDKIVRRI